MSLNIRNAKSGISYPPLEAGTYVGVCCSVVDLGLQKTSYNGNDREVNQILLTFEIPDELIEYDNEMKPRWISNTYTFSMNEKSRLRNDLKTWRGRDFTETEMKDYNLAKLLGAPCMVNVTNTLKNGNVYAGIGSIVKLPKSVQPGSIVPSKKFQFDIDDRDTWAVFPELPQWVQDRVNGSLTLKNAGIRIDKDGKPYEFTVLPDSKVGQEEQTTEADISFSDIPIDDEDLPF